MDMNAPSSQNFNAISLSRLQKGEVGNFKFNVI